MWEIPLRAFRHIRHTKWERGLLARIITGVNTGRETGVSQLTRGVV